MKIYKLVNVTFSVKITSTKVVNNQRFNNMSTKLQRITKTLSLQAHGILRI